MRGGLSLHFRREIRFKWWKRNLFQELFQILVRSYPVWIAVKNIIGLNMHLASVSDVWERVEKFCNAYAMEGLIQIEYMRSGIYQL